MLNKQLNWLFHRFNFLLQVAIFPRKKHKPLKQLYLLTNIRVSDVLAFNEHNQ